VEPAALVIDADLLNHGLESTEYACHHLPWKKQYEIWRHGDELIKSAKSRHDFEVAIVQFQRAVEQRDTILEQVYRFRTIPWFPPNDQYSTMTALGIIRRSLKKPLRELRNKILHEITDVALDRNQCEHLCDTAWYYLKATDLLARQCATTLEMTCGEDDPHRTNLTFTFNPGSWTIAVNGEVPDRHVLAAGSPQNLIVAVTTSSIAEYRGIRKMKFSGRVMGPEFLCRRLVQTFFDEAI
jgi:hypothetical protein